ncbi:SRPBCC family protein [Mucilaginibacter sp. UYCu711]|uniref:SRPBCC family protein n=1 Tax=Mucilaginibacter sp. UYCu711 TaxID=3156339 RepID=UPI003D1C3FE2
MAAYTSKINIKRSLTDVYQFLADFNNHQQLMPDNIQNWTSTFNEASFGIQNMVQLSLKISERIENKSIKITAVNGPPFPVQLSWELTGDADNTLATFTINAELNMMMKMMASGPLQKLADHETSSLAAAVK